MRNFYFGLDLGHNEIKLSVLEETSSGELTIYNTSTKNNSFYKSEIIEPNQLIEILENLFSNVLESFALKRIESINLTLSLPNFQTHIQKGHTIFENNVTEADIERVIKTAKSFLLLSNQEIILTENLKFIIDGFQEVRDPIGFSGKRLDAEVFFVSCHSAILNKVREIFKKLGIEIRKILPALYCSSKFFLLKKDKEIGTLVFEIGDSVTSLGVYYEGKLTHFQVFDWGAKYLFEDLALYLKTDLDEIEEIKKEIFKEELEISKKKSKYTKIINFLQKNLKEYLDKLKMKEIVKDLKKQYKLPGGLVVFGQFLMYPYLTNVLKNYFEMQIKYPKDEFKIFDTFQDLMKFSASAGAAILMKNEKYEESLWAKIKNIFSYFSK